MKERIGDMERELDAKMKEIGRLRDLAPSQDDYCPVQLRIDLLPVDDEMDSEKEKQHAAALEILRRELERARKRAEDSDAQCESAQAQTQALAQQLALQCDSIKVAELDVPSSHNSAM